MIEFHGTSLINKKFYYCHFNSIDELIDFIIVERLAKSRKRKGIKERINKAIHNNKKYLGMKIAYG